MIIITRFIPAKFDAITIWPLILIRAESRNDAALIEHELVHYREQRWITPWWVARYLLSRSFRLDAEVRAYKRQIEVGGITCEGAARMLLQYRLRITIEHALAALK